MHDLRSTAPAIARNSTGGYVKGRHQLRILAAADRRNRVGYAARDYVDPRLQPPARACSSSASLVWTATPLTTAKFYSDTTIDETTVPGISGVLTHIYTVEVDHDFRRWLTAIGKFTWGELDYQGDDRTRQDLLGVGRGDLQDEPQRSGSRARCAATGWIRTSPGNSTASTVVMLGVRIVQH